MVAAAAVPEGFKTGLKLVSNILKLTLNFIGRADDLDLLLLIEMERQ